MSAFATLPFDEQLAHIEAVVRGGDASQLMREAGDLPDAEPLARLLEALAAAGRLDDALERDLSSILRVLPDPSLQHLLTRSMAEPECERLLCRIVETALSTWSIERINAIALLSHWLRRRAPVGYDRVVANADHMTRQGLGDGRWLLFLSGARLAELARHPDSSLAVAGTVAKAVDALARAPKSISQANAEDLLARRVYADAGHFFFELLQNADDAGAHGFEARVERGRVLVVHDGEPFSFRDLVGVLSIGQTTKRAEQIGFFGVGFKSVYEICERPRIHSGAFDIEIAHVSIPRLLATRPPEAGEGDTVVILPLLPAVPVEALLRQALAIPPETLMTLPNLTRLGVCGPDGHRGTWVERREGQHVTLRRDGTDDERRYLAMERTARFEGAREEGRPRESPVLVAVALDSEGGPSPLSGPSLFSHLPTGERSGLRVLVHARFDVTVDRERLELDSTWNEALMQTAGQALADAALLLAEAGVSPLPVLPTARELAPVAASLGQALRERLADACCLPGADGAWLSPGQSRVMPGALARELAGLDLGGGARALLPVPEREREAAAFLGASPLGAEELVTCLEAALAIGAPRPAWLGPAVLEALAEADMDDARLAALPLLVDGGGRMVAAAHARVARASWVDLYATLRPLVVEDEVDALPLRLRQRLALREFRYEALCDDLRDVRLGAALLEREGLLLRALGELSDELLSSLDDVPVLRDAQGRRCSVDKGLCALSTELSPLLVELRPHVTLVAEDLVLEHGELVERWVPTFDLEGLARLLLDVQLPRSGANLLLVILDEQALRLGRGIARRFAERPLFPDQDGQLRPLLGDGRVLRSADAELEAALRSWPWLALERRPFLDAMDVPVVGARDVLRALIGEAPLPAVPAGSLEAVYAWLSARAEELPVALVERLVEAPVWLDEAGRPQHLDRLRRGSRSEALAAYFDATGSRVLAHPSTIRFASALRLERHLPATDHGAVVVDLLFAGSAPGIDRELLLGVLEEAAAAVSPGQLAPLCDVPLFADEAGRLRPLVSWSQPDELACHRPGRFRGALRPGAMPLLAERDEASLASFLAVAAPAPAGLRQLLERAARDAGVVADPGCLREALVECAGELGDAERQVLSSLALFNDRTGEPRRGSELVIGSRLARVLGSERVETLALDDSLVHAGQEAVFERLGLSPRPAADLLVTRVLPALREGLPLIEQPAPWRDPVDLIALLELAQSCGVDILAWPLALDGAGCLARPPRFRATQAERQLLAGLALRDRLASEQWATGLTVDVAAIAPRLPARFLAEALRDACPEERPRADHAIVTDLAALFEWLREAARSIEDDETARNALGGACVLPSQKGTLRAPRSIVLDPSLPDLGLGWGLAEDVPADVARWLADTYDLDRAQRNSLIEHVLDGLAEASTIDDRPSATRLIRFLAQAVGALSATTEELEALARRTKIRARLSVPTVGGGWDKPRRLWMPTDEVAAQVEAFASQVPQHVALPHLDEASRRLLEACGAKSNLDERQVTACLDGEGVRPGLASQRALARYVAERVLAEPARIDRWKLRARAWAPDRSGISRRPAELLWPDELAVALLGDDHERFVDAEVVYDLPEDAGSRLGFRQARDLPLSEVARHVGAREAGDALLRWLEEGFETRRLSASEAREVLRDRLLLRDDAGVLRAASEVSLGGARELFGARRGDWAAGARFPELSKALGIRGRPGIEMIVAFVVEIGAELDRIGQERGELIRHLPRCYERLGEEVDRGAEVRLPSTAATAGLSRGDVALVRVDDPALCMLDPSSFAESLPEHELHGLVDPMPTLDRGEGLRRLLLLAGVPDLWTGFRTLEVLPGPGVEERGDEAEQMASRLRHVLGRDVVGREAVLVDGLTVRGERTAVTQRGYRASEAGTLEGEVDAVVHDSTLWLTERALDDPTLLAPALVDEPARREAMRAWLAAGQWQSVPGRMKRPRDEEAPDDGPGLLERMRRMLWGDGEEPARAREPQSEPRGSRRDRRRREAEEPRSRDRAFFRPEGSLGEQLEGGEGWVESRTERPDFGFAFVPARLPAPWLYAPKVVATRFDMLGQRWRSESLARPEVHDAEGSMSMRGRLPDGDAVLPIPLYGRLDDVRIDGSEGRTVRGPGGGVVLRLDEAAEVRLRIALGRMPVLDRCVEADVEHALVSFVPDGELPEEVHDVLADLDDAMSAVDRALAVRDFIRRRYRYDPSYLEDPAVGRWLSRLTRGRANRHIAALHAARDERHLGAGVCYELNTLACELLRRARVPAAIASGWVLDGGALSEADHLWAIALLNDAHGAPAWVPIDASTTRDGRPLRVPRRPPGRFRTPKDPRAQAPQPPKTDLGAGPRHDRGGSRRLQPRKKESAGRKRRRPPHAELLRVLKYLERTSGRALTLEERTTLDDALTDERAARRLLERLLGD